MTLPTFTYHPDPVATGSVVPSDKPCACCGEVRGYIYAGPVYATEALDQCLCPWCIADGSAHRKFEATFTDETGVGGYGDWDPVPEAVVEISTRTPSFLAWQQERWWTHCGDGALFLGSAGRKEVEACGPELIQALREEAGLDESGEWQEYFAALDKEGSPTAYVFRCRKCGQLGGFSDCD